MSVAARKHAGYGWVPDLPDRRDHVVPFKLLDSRTLAKRAPEHVDLRGKLPEPYDQGQLGSCTGNALAAAVEFVEVSPSMPSRLFIYYAEREIEGTIASDSGAMLRDGLKVLATEGAPPETAWPYDIARFAEKPPQAVYAQAKAHEAIQYQSLRFGQYRACLAAGYPFAFGFSVYESFESADVARTGKVPMPAQGESLLGGHAVLAVGYDNPGKRIIVRNSWGPDWGDGGHFTLPYDYFDPARSLADDFWTIRKVS